MDRSSFESMFDEVPIELTVTERNTWLNNLSGVAVGSDAFFPFRDNVDRARLVSSFYRKYILTQKLLSCRPKI